MSRLAEIDENLIRNELHYTQRGEHLAERKRIYEELWPESTKVEKTKKHLKHFIASAESAPAMPSFTADTSAKAGVSRRVIQEEIQIAERLAPEVIKVVRELDIPKSEALELARMGSEEQKAVTQKLKSGRAKNVKAAKQQLKQYSASDKMSLTVASYTEQ